MLAAKGRVLLVDDEPQILTALEDLLGEQYTVLTSETPEYALEMLRNDHQIAVVISDQRMPHMSGDEFLRQMAGRSHALSIMVSGFADLPSVLRAINEGKIFAFITKPWNEQQLLEKVHDAAERFRLAEQVEYERRLLRDLMDNSPDGIYFKDADLRFLRANRAYAESVGAPTTESLKGWRLSELEGNEHEGIASETADRLVLREGRPILDSLRRSAVEGRTRFTSETKAPISGAFGDVVGIVGIARDVTERVVASQQLARSQRMEIIGHLAGGIAHDFNNLLSIVAGCAELTLEELAEGDSRSSNVRDILAAARQGSLLTQQLLAFSRQQTIEPKDLQLNQIVTGVESILRRFTGERIHFSLSLAPELCMISADQSQIEQVLLNLVVNARDAMPEGGELRIATGEELLSKGAASVLNVAPGRYVSLTVTDTGMGMTEATRAHLFEPFFTTKDVGKGTGLGLTTVYGVVSQNAGHIAVRSALGKGTEFRILLPQSPTPKPVPSSVPPSRSGRSAARPFEMIP